MNIRLEEDNSSLLLKNRKQIFYVLGFLSLFYYTFLLLFNKIDRTNQEIVFWIFLLQILFLLSYLLVKSSKNNYSNLIIWLGGFFGILMSFTQISLSDDIFRYLFNGHLLRNNSNPYLYSPDSLNMKEIINSFPFFDMINNTSISDPYPPFMLIITYLITLVTGNSLILWKLVTTLSIIIISIFIKKFLIIYDKNPNNVILWAWNPLVILEFSHSGHNDIFALIFLTLAIFLLVNKKLNSKSSRFFSGLFWATSIGLKIFPIFILIFFIKKLKIEGLLGLFTGFVANLLIIILLGSFSTAGLSTFLNYWRFNGGIYEIVNSSLLFLLNNLFSLGIEIPSLRSLTRIVFAFAIIIFSLIIVYYYFKNDRNKEDNRMFQYSGYIFLMIFLLTPILNPWYITWILPIYVFMPDKPWKRSYFVLSIMVLYSYYSFVCECEDIIILLIEYIPVYFIAIYELILFIKVHKSFKRYILV
ncbi:MAG: glycosyltransferase 87 family protein [Candidatus Hodarchaeales archaeon]|jgi:hypothetical protein